jgi:hypothetical protein
MQLWDYAAPVIAGLIFVAIMSRVREAVRLPLNAVLVIGASGVYMSGGFGLWEVAYAMLAGPVLGYFALRSYYVIGVGWLLHATWDILHHLYGHPIWPFMPGSSAGCLIFDTVIGVWFLAGAKSPFGTSVQERPAAVNARGA